MKPITLFTKDNYTVECLYCGAPCNGHSDIGPGARPPEPDDFCICIHCHGVSVFTADSTGRLGLRVPSPVETAQAKAMLPDATARMVEVRTTLRAAGLLARHEWDRE